MILYVGGKGQGMEQAVQERFAGACRLILYPENTLKDRLQERAEGKMAMYDPGDASPIEQASRIAEDLAQAISAAEEPAQAISAAQESVQAVSSAGEPVQAISAAEEPAQAVLPAGQQPTVVISRLVGCGVIPMDPMEELYREAVGQLQQKLAAHATEVYRVICGIPECLKGKKDKS